MWLKHVPWFYLCLGTYFCCILLYYTKILMMQHYRLLYSSYKHLGSSTLMYQQGIAHLIQGYALGFKDEWAKGLFAPLFLFLETSFAEILFQIRELKEWEQKKDFILSENTRRAKLRHNWLRENPTRLYFNECDGVYAVLSPQAYEVAHNLETVVCYDDEYHQGGHRRLAPALGTYLFFKDKEACRILITDHLDQNSKRWERLTIRKGLFRNWRMLDELESTLKPYDVELIKRPDIFIPYIHDLTVVTDEVLPCNILTTYNNLEGILDSQAPADLQPLPDSEPSPFIF